MKFVISTLLCLSLISISYAAMWAEYLKPCPEHPGRCYKPGPPEINIRAGSSKKHPDQCTQLICEKGKGPNKGKYILRYQGCGAVIGGKNCKVIEERWKPYPNCCPKTVCS